MTNREKAKEIVSKLSHDEAREYIHNCEDRQFASLVLDERLRLMPFGGPFTDPAFIAAVNKENEYVNKEYKKAE